MKKLLVTAISCVAIALLAAGAFLFFAPRPSSAHSAQTDTAQLSVFALEHSQGSHAGHQDGSSPSALIFSCGVPDTQKIINVTENITNDVDSGIAGNYWAFDTVSRHIQVWSLGSNTYCATISYFSSTFQAVAGQTSPGATGTLTGDEYGSFAGGYQTTNFTAQLNPSNPSVWGMAGRVNDGQPINYQCDISGNCPAYVDWSAEYFTNISGFDLAAWGWKYKGKDAQDSSSTGLWINASTGTSGDILDVDA
ncbi:MAG TPA: hypothetical protein VKQ30_09000 [Ktedonobacterales bacterium]|nr:hypothetical protein [Ktedonobacterales bacterium]